MWKSDDDVVKKYEKHVTQQRFNCGPCVWHSGECEIISHQSYQQTDFSAEKMCEFKILPTKSVKKITQIIENVMWMSCGYMFLYVCHICHLKWYEHIHNIFLANVQQFPNRPALHQTNRQIEAQRTFTQKSTIARCGFPAPTKKHRKELQRCGGVLEDGFIYYYIGQNCSQL